VVGATGSEPATPAPKENKAERATHGDTVGALFDLYKTHRQKAKSWTETRRIMEREVLPVWRHLRVIDVKRRTVRELVERKARHAPIMANRILSRISAMLTFAMEQDWIESNPAWRIRQPGEERSRDRVLSGDELPNPGRYGGQRIFVVRREDYVYLVLFVEDEHTVFLKTIILSRKATKQYLGEESDHET
jgi:hypothetical protein